ncbi:MAG: ribonuclease J, partial [Rhodobacteraceae bacterium]|nr:ribonuclease J [Paracoccaceae bacterium]
MSTDRLIYLPLGGAGEIGMNAYVYGYGPKDKERLIVVDLGVTFPDMDGTPGVDLIFPDISWLEERRNQIEAIFITHAHEDHVGAVGHLWEKLGAPVYARAFTAHIARGKLAEYGLPETVVRTASCWPNKVTAGPFDVSFVPVSHSIPESSALAIVTPSGRLIHTGDFKLDRSPIVGEPFDETLWKEVAKDGVKALICDSTNVFSTHEGRSESSLGHHIEKLVADAPHMVVATTFASNVARVKTLADAGKRAGRSICLMGRAMRRMIEAALETGVLSDFPKTVSPEDADAIPRENLMLLVTGSQGERRAASAQLAAGKFQGMELKEGDLFLFSSKTIPGNEKGVIRIINQLSEKGVDVVDDSSGHYHVSGHANQPDLSFMHQLVDPQIVIPMHGEHRHLRAHSKLAQDNGKLSLVCVNGMMLDLSGNAPKVVEYIDTGRVYLDGKVQYGALDGIVRDRIRMALNGLVIINVV